MVCIEQHKHKNSKYFKTEIFLCAHKISQVENLYLILYDGFLFKMKVGP